jgi:hypothetical protein
LLPSSTARQQFSHTAGWALYRSGSGGQRWHVGPRRRAGVEGEAAGEKARYDSTMHLNASPLHNILIILDYGTFLDRTRQKLGG